MNTPKDNYPEIFKDVEKVLVVLSHPDDAEVVCGGTISRLTAEGKQVRLVVTTNGGKGMQDKEGFTEQNFALERTAEQKRAGEIMGILPDQNFNLEIPDGEFENSVENIGLIVKHIREFKPDLVITHNPSEDLINFNNEAYWVNHRDHRKTGQTVLDACYPYSRDRGFFTDQFAAGLTSHSVTKVLLSDSYTHPEVKYFEITDFIDQKKKAIQSHPSAINPDYADGYIEENLFGERYFEPLRYIEIY